MVFFIIQVFSKIDFIIKVKTAKFYFIVFINKKDMTFKKQEYDATHFFTRFLLRRSVELNIINIQYQILMIVNLIRCTDVNNSKLLVIYTIIL